MPDCSEIEADLNFINGQIVNLQETIAQAENLLTELSQLAQLLQQLLFECQQGGGEGEMPPPESAVVPASATVARSNVSDKLNQAKQLGPWIETMQRSTTGACQIMQIATNKEGE